MRRQKNFNASASIFSPQNNVADNFGDLIIYLESNPSDVRTIDLTKWLDQGIDEWVFAFIDQLRIFQNGKNVTSSTLASYGLNIPYFFKFLIQRESPCKINDLSVVHLEQFIVWLGDDSKLKLGSKKSRYDRVKPVLRGLQVRDVIPKNRSIFPLNPFSGSNTVQMSESPLSQDERVRLADALRSDIVAIYKGRFQGTEGEALTIHALVLALRTGLNPTPLLELGRNSLKPHPFMPNMMMLESFKRRGNATHLKGLRYSKEMDDLKSIPMDGVAIFKKILERTQPLIEFASEGLQDCLWLYRKERSLNKSEITKLTYGMLIDNTSAIIDRHNLCSDTGERMRLNTSRLRKTLENRLWALSNGDLFNVASVMGHSPQVADTNYLSCTTAMRRDATFVGEALPGMYRNDGIENTDQQVANRSKGDLENTPVGSCKDSLQGDKSPKNGSHCSDFLSCFTCRSYAIVGAPEDLHRLFSFYWFLDSECKSISSPEWQEQFSETIEIIDKFTQDKFDLQLVLEAKEAARITPSKFWKRYRVESTTEGNDDIA